MRRLGYCVLLLGLVTTGLQLALVGPHLPAHVASHFGVNGRPDAWMPRWSFLTFFAVIQVGMPALLLGIGKLIYVLPTQMINLPNKSYWLHTDRRKETLRSSESVLIWIAGLTALFLSGVLWSVLYANLTGGGLPGLLFLTMLAVYVLSVVGPTLGLYRRFGNIA